MGKEHFRIFGTCAYNRFVNTSSWDSWRVRFRFADLAAVYIAEGGHSSAVIVEGKNVECPVPQKASGAQSRNLTEIILSVRLLVARLTTVNAAIFAVFFFFFVIKPGE